MSSILIPPNWVAVCVLLAFFIGMLGGVSMMIRGGSGGSGSGGSRGNDANRQMHHR